MDVAAVARLLAGEHMAEDTDMKTVLWHPAANEVRLVEVSGSVPSTGAVLPFRYAPTTDVPYRALVILIGPEDWERVRNRQLDLPPEFTEVALEKIA